MVIKFNMKCLLVLTVFFSLVSSAGYSETGERKYFNPSKLSDFLDSPTEKARFSYFFQSPEKWQPAFELKKDKKSPKGEKDRVVDYRMISFWRNVNFGLGAVENWDDYDARGDGIDPKERLVIVRLERGGDALALLMNTYLSASATGLIDVGPWPTKDERNTRIERDYIALSNNLKGTRDMTDVFTASELVAGVASKSSTESGNVGATVTSKEFKFNFLSGKFFVPKSLKWALVSDQQDNVEVQDRTVLFRQDWFEKLSPKEKLTEILVAIFLTYLQDTKPEVLAQSDASDLVRKFILRAVEMSDETIRVNLDAMNFKYAVEPLSSFKLEAFSLVAQGREKQDVVYGSSGVAGKWGSWSAE